MIVLFNYYSVYFELSFDLKVIYILGYHSHNRKTFPAHLVLSTMFIVVEISE